MTNDIPKILRKPDETALSRLTYGTYTRSYVYYDQPYLIEQTLLQHVYTPRYPDKGREVVHAKIEPGDRPRIGVDGIYFCVLPTYCC